MRTRVSLLSLHSEHNTCSPPLRTVRLKNSDRQSCGGQAGRSPGAAGENQTRRSGGREQSSASGVGYLDGAAPGVPGDGQGQDGEGLRAVRPVLTVQTHHHVAQLALEEPRHHGSPARRPAARPLTSPLSRRWKRLLLLCCLVDKHKQVVWLLFFCSVQLPEVGSHKV